MRLKIPAVLAICCFAISISAQIETNRPIRSMSLEQAVRLALENNLQLARIRYEPQLAQFRLSGSYSYYEPQFSASAFHSYSEREGQTIDPVTGLPILGAEIDSDSFGGNPALRGILPFTGLQYEIGADFSHRSGVSGGRTIDDYQANIDITLRQPLLRNLWIDEQRLSIRLARKDLKISEYAVLGQMMETINAVQQAYYDLMAALDDVKAREISLSLAQRLVDENRQRVKVGTMAPLDEKQAESEAALRQAELILARSEVTRMENILKSLISKDYQEWHNVAIVPNEKLIAVQQTYDVQESWANGLQLRPDYHEAKERVERQGLVVKYTFNQLFPSLDIVGSYGRSGFDSRTVLTDTNGNVIGVRDSSFSGTLADIRDEINPSYSYGVILTVPLTFRSERARHRTEKGLLEQAKLDLQIVHQNVLIGIKDAIQAAQAAYERVEATRAGREFAQVALDAEQKKLDNGRSTSFVVLQLQRDLTTARSQEIDALSDYNKALSTLYNREGTILKRNNINVEVSP